MAVTGGRNVKRASILVAFLCLLLLPFHARAEEGDALRQLAQEQQMTLRMENDRLAFLMDEATAHFLVYDKQSGAIYRSNPADWDSNPLMQSNEFIYELGSAVILNYYDEASVSYTMNSYRDSVLLGQFSILQSEDNPYQLSVEYIIGPDQNDRILPDVITQETFEKYVLNCDALTDLEKASLKKCYKLYNETEILKIKSQTERDNIYAKYPHVLETPIYELRSSVNNATKKQLREYIQRSDLTIEMVEQDALLIQAATAQTKPTYYITVEYTLENDGLTVRIPQEDFAADDKFHLTSIQVLKYFHAMPIGTPGEILVPDGSGAVIDTAVTYATGVSSMALELYGSDLIKDATVESNTTGIQAQPVLMPVWGVSDARSGMLAIIERCDAAATINVNMATSAFAYSCVSPTFTVLPRDYVNYGSMVKNSYAYLFPSRAVGEDIQLRYIMLEEGSNGYAGMARAYQRYLENRGDIQRLPQEEPYPFAVTLLGGIVKPTSIMGVPVNAVVPLTSYADVQTMAERLTQDGVEDLNIRYRAWSNDGYFSSFYDSIRLSSRLGGKKDFLEMAGALSQQGVKLYADVELLYVSMDRLLDSFNPNAEGARTMIQKVAAADLISPITLTSDNAQIKRTPISPAVTPRMLSSCAQDLKELGVQGVSLGEYGTQLLSDYRNKEEVFRTDALQLARSNLQYLRETGLEVMLDGSAIPLAAYADLMVDTPLSNSQYKLEKAAVPFMQMVLHGYQNYVGTASNMADDRQQNLLRVVESGAGLSYIGMTAEDDALIHTVLVNLYYSLNEKNWYEEALQNYRDLKAVFDPLQSQRIVDHVMHSMLVRETVYEDGTRILVNYGSETAQAGDVSIPAQDYIVVPGKGG